MVNPEISIIVSVFKGQEFFSIFLENLSQQSAINLCEVIIILNNPTKEEFSILLKLVETYSFIKINVIQLDFVESIYQSWNRAWKIAKGKYITSWNIDDFRFPNSLQDQYNFMELNPDIHICYGDFLEKYINTNKIVQHITPEFSKNVFSRKFLSGGAFLMWRNFLKEDVGLFDEQFKIAGDFEYVTRCCISGRKMAKVRSILGTFTNNLSGLSTQPNSFRLNAERATIQIRYGIFDKIKIEHYDKNLSVSTQAFFFEGEFKNIKNYIPKYVSYIRKRKLLWVVCIVKNIIRRSLIVIGFWNYFVNKIEKRNLQILDISND